MPIVPTRYAYILVGIVLVTIFYTTTVSSYDSAPVFRKLRNGPFSTAGSHRAGAGNQGSLESDEASDSLYPPAPRPDAHLEPIPSFQKPDVLPTDDKTEQKWIESQDEGSADEGQTSWNSTETLSEQDAAAAAAAMPHDPATKVYSAEGSSSTWSVSPHADDGSKSHGSADSNAGEGDSEDGDTNSDNASHASKHKTSTAATSSKEEDESYEFE